MSIFGTCSRCGCTTMDYLCGLCLRDENAALKAQLAKLDLYVVQLGSEVIAVYGSLPAATGFVERREGQALTWQAHDSHGPLWEAYCNYQINNGPMLANHWAVTRHELRVG